MAEDIRMIAVDLDQTLITSERTVCAESFQALQDAVASGIHVVVATARQWSSTQSIAAALGNDQPVICNNGADIMANAAAQGDSGFLFCSSALPPVRVGSLLNYQTTPRLRMENIRLPRKDPRKTAGKVN